MILGIHQPQYLPWLPYYSKISQSNIFVFLDNVQFQKNGLHNRNEVINSNGRFWLTVPVDAKLGDSLSEVNIINNGWEKKHTKSLRMNYSKAKNFEFYERYIEPQILKRYKKLIDLNIALIRTISENFFGLKVEFIKQSEIVCNEKGSNLILEICNKLKAKKYISGLGGKNYLNEIDFKKKNIEVTYLKNNLPKTYNQVYSKNGFINDVSALDFILNSGQEWEKYYKL